MFYVTVRRFPKIWNLFVRFGFGNRDQVAASTASGKAKSRKASRRRLSMQTAGDGYAPLDSSILVLLEAALAVDLIMAFKSLQVPTTASPFLDAAVILANGESL